MTAQLSEIRFKNLEDKALNIEGDVNVLKDDVHKIKNDMMVSTDERAKIKAQVEQVATDTSEILRFVSGVNTVGGLAKKHWKLALTFGAGVMTSLGIGNPQLLKFITTFFGLTP